MGIDISPDRHSNETNLKTPATHVLDAPQIIEKTPNISKVEKIKIEDSPEIEKISIDEESAIDQV